MPLLTIVRHQLSKIEVQARRVVKPDASVQFDAFAVPRNRELVSSCRQADVPVASIAVGSCFEVLVVSDANNRNRHACQRFSVSIDDLTVDASCLRVHTDTDAQNEKDHLNSSHIPGVPMKSVAIIAETWPYGEMSRAQTDDVVPFA